MRWRRFGMGLALLLGLGLLSGSSDRLVDFFDPVTRGGAPDGGAYVGQTLGSIQQRLGQPSRRWPGQYACPGGQGARDCRPIFSTAYERRSGTLYLAFQPLDEDWVCYTSTWLPGGEDF